MLDTTLAPRTKGMKRYPDEIKAYKQAIALKPDYAKAYYNMGVAYRQLNRLPSPQKCLCWSGKMRFERME